MALMSCSVADPLISPSARSTPSEETTPAELNIDVESDSPNLLLLPVVPPPIPPKPAHLSLLAFPRLSVLESHVHSRQVSERTIDGLNRYEDPDPVLPLELNLELDVDGVIAARNQGATSPSWEQDEAEKRGNGSRGAYYDAEGLRLQFDAGHNASSAWAVGVEEHDHDPRGLRDGLRRTTEDAPREARSLYAFFGESDNELSFEANSSLLIHAPEIGSGWSLASIPHTGALGLCPQSYYVYISAFTLSPGLHSGGSFLSARSGRSGFGGSRLSVGSGGSRSRLGSGGSSYAAGLGGLGFGKGTGKENGAAGNGGQGTLDWLRRSVLGERSLNRPLTHPTHLTSLSFSGYVLSGAEEYILRGAGPISPKHASNGHGLGHDHDTQAHDGSSQFSSDGIAGERHHVDDGPRWRELTTRIHIRVHGPVRRHDANGKDFVE
ncbi:hypothetical protein JCM24511_07210 [Saitozyma sp. JCM 24511]|nr:hypothetical protein JCM24511_07210 [Saitozyma sp. JCM 24511]